MFDSFVKIRVIRGTGWDSKVIEYRTRSLWSHIEAIPNAYPYETFGAMLAGGVNYRHITDACYRKVNLSQTWGIPCLAEQNKVFWNFLEDQKSKKYDWRAIFAFDMGERDWDAPDSWICSELQMAALKAAGIWNPQGDMHVDRIDPNMAYLLVTSLPGAYLVSAQ